MDSIKKNILKNTKSKVILKHIFSYITEYKLLILIKCNKLIQKKLGLGIIDYKNYYFEHIEIEIYPKLKKEKNIFINFLPKSKSYYHIYFNDMNHKEIKRNYFTKNDNIQKIKIVLDKEIKSFEKLFEYCSCIEKINFKKFYRNDINDMNNMFSGCASLKEINMSNLITENVTNMSWMFSGCVSLTKINLSNYNTNQVTNMTRMFNNCKSLQELNLNNFNAKNVTDMSCMFFWMCIVTKIIYK